MIDLPSPAATAAAPRPRRYTALRLAAVFCLAALTMLATIACGEDCKEEVKERCEKECDRVGSCKIEYTFSSGGDLTETKRVCQFSTDKVDVSLCGVCTDIETNAEGKITAKTCQVCNLCTSDFECLEDSECKVAAPVCDSGICVSCVTNGDCTAENRDKDTPICDTVTQQCIGCKEKSDCASSAVGIWCDKTSNKCVDGCDDNVDCEKNDIRKRCDTTTNKCVDGCSSDTDCEKNETRKRCDTEIYKCVACAADKDCEATDRPQCFEGECVPCRCSITNASAPNCLQNPTTFTVSCVGCSKDTDCSASDGTPSCDGTTGKCVAECGSDNDCQAKNKLFCDNGSCTDCRSGQNDCSTEQRPLCIQGTCGCNDDNDCTGSLNQCYQGQCVQCVNNFGCTSPGFPICDNGKCSLRPCSTADDCTRRPHLKCRAIGPQDSCVECASSADCTDPAEPNCDTGSWTCVK